MRAALIRETARLLKLGNIGLHWESRPDRRHARRVLPAPGQQRHRAPPSRRGGLHHPGPAPSTAGRLFLPFADDDPNTAEIVSKALLLARDAEIRDPAILRPAPRLTRRMQRLRSPTSGGGHNTGLAR